MSGDSSGRTGTLVRGSGQGYASSSIIERRRRILTTARKMIGAEGMAAINMDEISRRADVAKRTLYNAFQSKERLIAEAIQQYFDDYEIQLPYTTPPATGGRVAEHIAIFPHRNPSIRNYTRALTNIYFSADVDFELRRTIGEIVAHTHRPWIERLHAERQLQPWIERDQLIDDILRYRYALAHDWTNGRVPDDEVARMLIVGVMTMVIGATKPRARRESEEVLRDIDAYIALRDRGRTGPEGAAAF